MLACPKCRLVFTTPVLRCGLHGDLLVESEVDPMIGTELARYRVESLLGAGAMGRVYLGVHTSLGGRRAALKVPSGESAASRLTLARLGREADVASRLRHDNIASVLDFANTPQGVPVLIMELVDGRTLRAAIEGDGPFPFARAASITRQLASAIGHAHARGFVHRDLKTGNVLLAREDDVAKILDFGIVDVSASGMDATRLTATGLALGTPVFMAPEQMRGGEVGPSADIYALGATLYSMIEGRPPFDGTLTEVVWQKVTGPKPPRVCGGLERLAMHMLSAKPAARPTAEEVVRIIDQLRTGMANLDVPKRGVSTDALMVAAGMHSQRRGVWIASLLALLIAGAATATWTLGSSGAVNPPLAGAAPAAPQPVAEAAPPPAPSPAPPATAHKKPRAAPPAVQASLQQGRANIVVTGAAGLRAARVHVDGEPRGEAPLQISLSAGEHMIEVYPEDNTSMRRTVEIRPGEVSKIVFLAP